MAENKLTINKDEARIIAGWIWNTEVLLEEKVSVPEKKELKMKIMKYLNWLIK